MIQKLLSEISTIYIYIAYGATDFRKQIRKRSMPYKKHYPVTIMLET